MPSERGAAFPYVGLLLAFLMSLAPITSSLWLDETATFWVVKDGLREVVSRSWEWSGQSALYYVTAWLGRHLAPYTGLEVALRLPSVLATLLALVLMYRLGRYLMGPQAGMLAALAFLCVPEVSFAAIDARPYALALALVIASMLCFLRWLDTGRPVFGVLYVVSAALVVYAHYLFALSLAAQLVYGRRRIRRLAPLWAAAGVLCLPLTGQIVQFYLTRQSHSFAAAPGLQSFYLALVPPLLAGTVLFSIIASKPTMKASKPVPWEFLFTWLIAPPAFLLAISLFTDTQIFVTRYYLSCVPAAALLTAYVVARCSAYRIASLILTVSLAFGIWRAGPLHNAEDWRGAMQAVNAQASGEDAVLVGTAFVEGTSREIGNPRLRDVLYAPQVAYPASQPIVRLPYLFGEKSLPGDLARRRRVFLVTRRATVAGLQSGLQYQCWLQQHLPGYTARDLGNFGGVSVVRFER